MPCAAAAVAISRNRSASTIPLFAIPSDSTMIVAPVSPQTLRASCSPRRYPDDRSVVPLAWIASIAAFISARPRSATRPAGTRSSAWLLKAISPNVSSSVSRLTRFVSAPFAASSLCRRIDPLRSRTTTTACGTRPVEVASARRARA